MKTRVVFLVVLSVIYGSVAEKAVIIENGPIVGDESDGFYAFRGIPYAGKAEVEMFRAFWLL